MKYRANASEPWVEMYIKALDSMPIGSIIDFVGTDIPNGWLICDGRTLDEETYPELYDALGGSGSTFTLPDCKGRVLVGYDANDTDFNAIGKTGGNKALQKHIHDLMRAYNATGFATPYGEPYSGWGVEQDGEGTAKLTQTQEAGTGASVGATNGNLQPYYVAYKIIKAKNTTPTMASIVDSYSTSTQDGYSCKFVNDQAIKTLYDKNETFDFNNNAYASKDITLPNNISSYKLLLINIGEGYQAKVYYDNMLIPANKLTGDAVWRKRVLFGGIQAYMSITYVSANKINIWLENSTAISGSKTINVNIQSLNNFQ